MSQPSQKINQLEQALLETHAQLCALKSEVELFTSILAAFGVNAQPWVSTSDAAKVARVDRRTISAKIEIALSSDDYGVTLGTHFRDISSAESTNPTWQINLRRLDELMAVSNKI